MKPLRLESLAYAHCDPGDQDEQDRDQQSFNRAVAVVRGKAEVSFNEVNIFPAPAIDPFGVGAGSVDATLGQVKFQSGKIPEGEYPNLRDRLSELGQ